MRKARKISLKRYAGKWNEIASFPAWFQRDCVGATAEYTEMPTFIGVVNTCTTRKGKTRNIKGKAFTTDENNVLNVQFFPPFKSDYIIEYVDTEYKHAIVGSTGKNYLWILSREKPVANDVYEKLVSIARKKGYDVSRLERKE